MIALLPCVPIVQCGSDSRFQRARLSRAADVTKLANANSSSHDENAMLAMLDEKAREFRRLRCMGNPWNNTRREVLTVHKAGVFWKTALVKGLAHWCGLAGRIMFMDMGQEDVFLRQLEGRNRLLRRPVAVVRDPVMLTVSGMLYHRSSRDEAWLHQPASDADRAMVATYGVYLAARQTPPSLLPPMLPDETYQAYLLRLPDEKALLAEMVRVSMVVPQPHVTTPRPIDFRGRGPLSILKENTQNAQRPMGYKLCTDKLNELDDAGYRAALDGLLKHWRVPEKDRDGVASECLRYLSNSLKKKAQAQGFLARHVTGSGSRHDLHLAVCRLDAVHFGGLFWASAQRVGCLPRLRGAKKNVASSGGETGAAPSYCAAYLNNK
jgi:hypothetical protein